MSSKVHNEVLQSIIFFKTLLNEVKFIDDREIELEEKANNPRWSIGSSRTVHSKTNDELEFIVEKSLVHSKYGVKLKCNKLYRMPFLRFDSDGPAHLNYSDNNSIDELQVVTPHFNTFDDNGREYAYQNDTLKNTTTAEAICNNIDFGIALFCDESKSQLHDDTYPICKRGLFTGEDFVSDFNLNNINFE